MQTRIEGSICGVTRGRERILQCPRSLSLYSLQAPPTSRSLFLLFFSSKQVLSVCLSQLPLEYPVHWLHFVCFLFLYFNLYPYYIKIPDELCSLDILLIAHYHLCCAGYS
ncbi:uncharacterized protein BDV14DRAFT_128486 [Aspergillus stella-maris]|uniref:uncharacterized protein n=1 Tax=Aspergillus stella-maris TaxID=1810926 RepID=UPI003CCCE48F